MNLLRFRLGSVTASCRRGGPGLMVNHPPGALFENENIGCDQDAPADMFRAQDEAAVGEHEGPRIGEPDRRRVAQNGRPAFHDRLAAHQQAPAGMDTGDIGPPRPERLHGGKIAGGESRIKGLVGSQEFLLTHPGSPFWQ